MDEDLYTTLDELDAIEDLTDNDIVYAKNTTKDGKITLLTFFNWIKNKIFAATLSTLDPESNAPINSSAVNGALADYDTSDEVNEKLENYDTSTEVTDKIDNALTAFGEIETKTDANDCIPADNQTKVYKLMWDSTNLPVSNNAGIIQSSKVYERGQYRYIMQTFHNSATIMFNRVGTVTSSGVTWSSWQQLAVKKTITITKITDGNGIIKTGLNKNDGYDIISIITNNYNWEVAHSYIEKSGAIYIQLFNYRGERNTTSGIEFTINITYI